MWAFINNSIVYGAHSCTYAAEWLSLQQGVPVTPNRFTNWSAGHLIVTLNSWHVAWLWECLLHSFTIASQIQAGHLERSGNYNYSLNLSFLASSTAIFSSNAMDWYCHSKRNACIKHGVHKYSVTSDGRVNERSVHFRVNRWTRLVWRCIMPQPW